MSASTRPNKAVAASHGEPSKIRYSTALWKVKCGCSLVTGIVLGILPVRGILGFICFLIVQALVGQIFLATMKLPDYVLDQIEALTEHFVPSFSIFLVSWVVTYSLYNY